MKSYHLMKVAEELKFKNNKTMAELKLEELNKKLKDACKQGDLDNVKYLLTSPDLVQHAQINIEPDDWGAPLTIACENGHLHIVKYLLTSQELKKHANIKGEDGRALSEACVEGHLDVVKYLLASPDLKEHAEINKFSSIALKHAAYNGHLEIVKYLLASPELKEHALINHHFTGESALAKAASSNQLAVVKFILNCKEIQDKPNTDSIEDAFKIAVYNQCLDVVKYLIFDFNIEQSETIQRFLSKNENDKDHPMDPIHDLFNKRELKQSLGSELSSNNETQKKLKL
jgi:ankyrin repeat protein